MVKPHVGMVFRHSSLQHRGRATNCVVTRVGDTTVYFEEVESGKRRSADILAFRALVGEYMFTFDLLRVEPVPLPTNDPTALQFSSAP